MFKLILKAMATLVGFSTVGYVCTQTNNAALEFLGGSLGMVIRFVGSKIKSLFSRIFGRNTSEEYEEYEEYEAEECAA